MNEEQNEKDEDVISFAEFKAWLSGLIQGKGGSIPDLADWKLIKEQIDRVEEIPIVFNTYPQYPQYPEPLKTPSPWDQLIELSWTTPHTYGGFSQELTASSIGDIGEAINAMEENFNNTQDVK